MTNNNVKRLWDKGETIDSLMIQLTVGDDYIVDKEMLVWDCIGSAAHAKMLEQIGILSKDETASLLKELKAIYELSAQGKIDIPVELEDAHNMIENLLVEKLGDTGKRIHVGRARNDQILVTMRLYLRDTLLKILQRQITFTHLCLERYDELKDVPLPGYTHTQLAMPSSVGMWLHAWIEQSIEIVTEGLNLLDILNINPLGASAGFGSNIPLDRRLTTKLLGFGEVQRSPIDCNNSRGRYELKLLRFAEDIASMFEKIACDIMLYTTREFGFFKLPVELTTGSSIMPQKRNSDLAELCRARASKVRATSFELSGVISKLISSYNRDLQYTKEPVLRGMRELNDMFKMAELLVGRFEIQRDKIESAMLPELYATYEANNMARAGMPYRDAYKILGKKVREPNYSKAGLESEFDVVAQQTDVDVQEAQAKLTQVEQKVEMLVERYVNLSREIFK
jgi:argininosuccinate lyase